jgi:hypothetical protein
MISVLLGLGLVALIGGGVAKYVNSNPTSATRLRSSRRRGGGKWDARLVLGAGRTVRRGWRWARTRKERSQKKIREAHAKAKKQGKSAKTRTMAVIKDRRGWKAALSDLAQWLGLAEPAEPALAEASPKAEEKPRPPEPSTDTEGGTPVPKPKPEPIASTRSTTPSIVTLFEVTDQMVKLPFESIMQIKQFVSFLNMGCASIATMYVNLGQRMAGPMSIDRIVTEPVERCGAHQRAVQGSLSAAEQYLIMLLNSSPQELLARNIRVPRAALINGEATALGRALVPMFYETASTLATRPFTDLRGVHVLLKALAEASGGQHAMYSRIARRLGELRLPGVSDHFWTAARQQHAITGAMADADTAMGRLLNMTIRELAQSNVRAPEVHLEGV